MPSQWERMTENHIKTIPALCKMFPYEPPTEGEDGSYANQLIGRALHRVYLCSLRDATFDESLAKEEISKVTSEIRGLHAWATRSIPEVDGDAATAETPATEA